MEDGLGWGVGVDVDVDVMVVMVDSGVEYMDMWVGIISVEIKVIYGFSLVRYFSSGG